MYIISIFRFLTEDLLQSLGRNWSLLEHDLASSINRAEVVLTCSGAVGIFRVVVVVSRSGEAQYRIEYGAELKRANQATDLKEILMSLAAESQRRPDKRIERSPLQFGRSYNLIRTNR